MSKWVVALRLVGVGWYIAGCIVLGILGGRWFDGKLHTEPLFMLLGLMVGLIVAFYGVYRMLLPLRENKQDKESS